MSVKKVGGVCGPRVSMMIVWPFAIWVVGTLFWSFASRTKVPVAASSREKNPIDGIVRVVENFCLSESVWINGRLSALMVPDTSGNVRLKRSMFLRGSEEESSTVYCLTPPPAWTTVTGTWRSFTVMFISGGVVSSTRKNASLLLGFWRLS